MDIIQVKVSKGRRQRYNESGKKESIDLGHLVIVRDDATAIIPRFTFKEDVPWTFKPVCGKIEIGHNLESTEKSVIAVSELVGSEMFVDDQSIEPNTHKPLERAKVARFNAALEASFRKDSFYSMTTKSSNILVIEISSEQVKEQSAFSNESKFITLLPFSEEDNSWQWL